MVYYKMCHNLIIAGRSNNNNKTHSLIVFGQDKNTIVCLWMIGIQSEVRVLDIFTPSTRSLLISIFFLCFHLYAGHLTMATEMNKC